VNHGTQPTSTDFCNKIGQQATNGGAATLLDPRTYRIDKKSAEIHPRAWIFSEILSAISRRRGKR
jgi:hypothetical protein